MAGWMPFQVVCSWNRFSPPAHEPPSAPTTGLRVPELAEWTIMTQEASGRRFKNSPIKRTRRRGLLRNVTVAPGNWGAPEGRPGVV